MTTTQIFAQMNLWEINGIPPRERETRMAAIAQQLNTTSDALRARVRRLCKAHGTATPKMRASRRSSEG